LHRLDDCALSRQLGVWAADDKELSAADVVFVATLPGNATSSFES
jgi:hypothetical protein